jgi:hypothetical protein
MTAQTGRDELTAALDPKLEIHAAVARIVREQVPDAAAVTVVERPRDASHGDYATNVALVLAKQRGAIRASWRWRSARPWRRRSRI